jgi:hypothetical protein
VDFRAADRITLSIEERVDRLRSDVKCSISVTRDIAGTICAVGGTEVDGMSMG